MLYNKFWQAFFALAPIIMFFVAISCYVVFLFSIIGNIEGIESTANTSASIILKDIGIFFALIIVTIFIFLGSLVFYIVHAVQNPNLKENNLLLVWILLFVFVAGIGQLLYWIIEIVNKRKQLPPPV